MMVTPPLALAAPEPACLKGPPQPARRPCACVCSGVGCVCGQRSVQVSRVTRVCCNQRCCGHGLQGAWGLATLDASQSSGAPETIPNVQSSPTESLSALPTPRSSWRNRPIVSHARPGIAAKSKQEQEERACREARPSSSGSTDSKLQSPQLQRPARLSCLRSSASRSGDERGVKRGERGFSFLLQLPGGGVLPDGIQTKAPLGGPRSMRGAIFFSERGTGHTRGRVLNTPFTHHTGFPERGARGMDK